MNKLLFIVFILIGVSCSENPVETPDFNSGIGGNDDLNPNPKPTPLPTPNPDPTPTPIVEVETLLPSDLNEKETTLVYRKFFFKTEQLGISSEHRYCDDNYRDKCIVNKQVIFHYPTDYLNNTYPKELWDITKINFIGSFYSIGENKRTELFCNLNLRKCSGRAIEKIFGIKFPKVIFRNGSFWRGDEKSHIMNDKFHDLLQKGKIRNGLYIRKDINLNLSTFLKLDFQHINTLIRKNKRVEFSVTDDTYVEDPSLVIEFTRRLPRRD